MDSSKCHNILVVDEEVEYAPIIEQILGESFPNISNLFWFVDEGSVVDFLNTKTSPTISITLLEVENLNFDGLALLRKLKDDSSPFKIIPIIIFSRIRDLSVICKSFSLGANSWVQKPTDLENFRIVIRAICEFWLKHTILPSSVT
ncbi:MAG: response regulator [Promethearchaeota archaeon]